MRLALAVLVVPLVLWLLGGHVDPAGRVLLFDDHGGENAPSVAEYLAGRGVTDIELVSGDSRNFMAIFV